MTPIRVPDVMFHRRVRDEALGGPNPYGWKHITSSDVFAGKRIVLFALPGAFTPACSDAHLPAYETHYDEFRQFGRRNHAGLATEHVSSRLKPRADDETLKQ